jgi:hypothetical protein
MKTIYIAGPMRGIKWFNFPAFDAAERGLLLTWGRVFNPAEMDRRIGFDPMALPESTDWSNPAALCFSVSDAIDRDIAAIRRSDAIYMLDGWDRSKGATAERARAIWLGLEVLYQPSAAESILDEAKRITAGDRQAAYGPPDQDFSRTAKMWSAIKGIDFEPRDVAMFLIALKLSRETHQRKRDNAVDIAGYAFCLDVCNRASGQSRA